MKKMALAAIAGIAMAGCGGGGGSTTPPPPPPPAPVALVSSTPAEGAVNVERGAALSASFNNPLSASSVTSANVKISGPSGNMIPSTVSVSGSTITLKPLGGKLPGGSRYTVSYGSGISDSNGSALIGGLTRTFTTTAQKWSDRGSTTPLSGDLVTVQANLFAADKFGNLVTATTVRSPDNISRLGVRRMDGTTGAWSDSVTLESASNMLSSPQPTRGWDGELYLSWAKAESPPASSGVVARFDATAKVWETLAAPFSFPAGTGSLYSHTVSVDAAGNIMAVAPASTNANGWGYYATRWNAKTKVWSSVKKLEVGYPMSSFPPNIQGDANGNVIVAFLQENTDSTRALRVIRYDAASDTWGLSAEMDHGIYTANPYIALDVNASGMAVLAWSRDGGRNGWNRVYFSRFDAATQAWSSPTESNIVPTQPYRQDSWAPTAAIDSTGVATVAWYEDQAIYTSRFDPLSKSWGMGLRVTPQGMTPNTLYQRLLADAVGNFTLVFMQNFKVMATRYMLAEGNWQSPVEISTPSGGSAPHAFILQVTSDPSGTISALWTESDTSTGTSVLSVKLNRLQ